jgi:coenzyme F420-reducing hydrogenase gamma subunit
MTIKYDIKLKQKLILANVQNMEFILKRMLSDIYKIKEYASKDNINQDDINAVSGTLQLDNNPIEKLNILRESTKTIISSN